MTFGQLPDGAHFKIIVLKDWYTFIKIKPYKARPELVYGMYETANAISVDKINKLEVNLFKFSDSMEVEYVES